MDNFPAIELAIFTLLGASLIAWGWAVSRLASRRPLLRHSPRRPPVPWGIVEVAGIVLVLLALVTLVQSLIVAWGWVERVDKLEELGSRDRLRLMAAYSYPSLVAIVFGLWFLRFRGADWSDLGLPGHPNWRDLQLGAVAFLLLLLPVYTTQWALTQFFPTQHPLIRLLRDDPNPAYLGQIFMVAVVVAPVVEEFLFRVVLQEWFRGIQIGRSQSSWWLRRPRGVQVHAISGRIEPQDGFAEAAAHVERDVPGVGGGNDAQDVHVWGAETGGQGGEDNPDGAADGSSENFPGWAILASALFWAGAHAGHGPDPVPLFFLGLGLGYLYHATGRVYPCIVVHVLINSLAVLQMWLFVTGRIE